MVTLVNRAKVSTSTTGTGTITLGAAESGYQTFAAAGVVNGDIVRYVIEDGTNWEIGTGTYTAAGTTLSRTVSESSNADNPINLSGSAIVYVGATASDFGASGVIIKAQGTSTADTSAGAVDVTWGTPSISGTSFSISGADITCNVDGTYVFMFSAVINYNNRCELTIQVELDTGGGYVAQAGEIMQDYVTRDANQNDGGVTLATAFELTAGDRIKLTAQSATDGTGTATLNTNGTRVVILSPRGAAGAQGPAGETWVALTQAQYDAITPDPDTLYLITG